MGKALESGRETLARAARGDDIAFAELVRANEARVFSMAYHFLRDRALAEELAQEVFLDLYQTLSSIRSSEHLVYWLRKVTSHRCIDQARRLRVRPELTVDRLPEPAADFCEPQDPMLSGTLRRLVSALPAKARMVVVLRYQEDMSPTEIAEVLGIPVNTVKSHLRRSLALLREKLSRCHGEVRI